MSISTLIAENQPETFSFTSESEAEIKQQIAKYPAGRQASAVKSLLYIVQKQNDNWIPMKAVEAVAERLEMPVMRVLEVASFYSMFNLKPVGKWYLQVCGTTPCMLRGLMTSVVVSRISLKLLLEKHQHVANFRC